MITFITDTALPIDAVTTMGISVKEGEGESIGRFGTGLKYTIAGILRLGGKIKITIDGKSHSFSTVKSTIRGKEFDIVRMGRKQLGFSTELGKHWQPWMYYRELVSNTLDEGGRWVNGKSSDGRTQIEIACREVEGDTEGVFIPREMESVWPNSYGHEIYAAPSLYYYYQGIRVGEWGRGVKAPFTINFLSANLTEDRTYDLHSAMVRASGAFMNPHRDSSVQLDEGLAMDFVRHTEGDFFDEVCMRFNNPNERLMEVCEAHRNLVTSKKLQELMVKRKKQKDGIEYETLPFSAQQIEWLNDAYHLAKVMNLSVPDRGKIFLTRDLPRGTYGVFSPQTNSVYISPLANTREQFVKTVIEECMHLTSGYGDKTRHFQEFIIGTAIEVAEKLRGNNAPRDTLIRDSAITREPAHFSLHDSPPFRRATGWEPEDPDAEGMV